MQKTTLKRRLCLVFAVLFFACSFLVFLTASAEKEVPTRFCYTTDSINFRKTPDLLSASKYSFGFKKYQVLPVLGEAQGASYNGSTLWYRVSYTYKPDGKEYIGYVHSKLVKLCEPFHNDTQDFADFPQSYRPYLAALKAAHPTWNFVALDTERDWSSAVAAQAEVTKTGNSLTSPSFIAKEYSSIYRSTVVVGGLDASKTLADGGTRYCASEETIAHYMDPRTSLDEVNIFMFSTQAYDENVHTLEGVKAMLVGTYMESGETKNADGERVSYAQAFLDAGVQTGISPYFLIVTAIEENGKNGTNLSKGNLTGGVCKNAGCSDQTHYGYYNFYGIGANSTGSPQHNGLLYAIDKGWNTAYKAIVGGASFMGDNYITKGQQTPYLKKFNVNPASPYGIWHQYMQNIERPKIDAKGVFEGILDGGLLESPHTFLIPVYRNMPEEVCAIPNTETYTPAAPSTPSVPGGTTQKPTKPTFTSVYTLDYTGFIYGVEPGTSEAQFRKGFTLGEGTTLTVSAPNVGTGTMVRILLDGKVYYTFYVVVRGDLSGNGKVEALDLLYLRDYLLKTKEVSVFAEKAADVDFDGTVKSLDLLKLRDAILKTYTISQKG